METRITSKHMTLTPAIEAYVTKKVERFHRFYDRIQEIEAIIDGLKVGHEVEILVKVEHHDPFVAKGEHEDLYACIDLAVDRSLRQLRDFKSKQRDNKHNTPARGTDV